MLDHAFNLIINLVHLIKLTIKLMPEINVPGLILLSQYDLLGIIGLQNVLGLQLLIKFPHKLVILKLESFAIRLLHL